MVSKLYIDEYQFLRVTKELHCISFRISQCSDICLGTAESYFLVATLVFQKGDF